MVFLPEESVTGKRRGEGEGWVEERWKGLSLVGAAGVRRWAPGSREGGDGKVSERASSGICEAAPVRAELRRRQSCRERFQG